MRIRFAILALALPAGVSAQVQSAQVQITSAVASLPAEFRANATVLGYKTGSNVLTELRAGGGPFICLADDPGDEARFHTACYHKSLEPFMARGRQLRAQGVTQVDSARNAEIIAKKIPMPASGALYSITGTQANLNTTTGELSGNGLRPLFVIYMPFATPESVGLPTRPSGNQPWIMQPGTPKAHIMFTPTM